MKPLATATIKCPACALSFEVPVSYRAEGVATQDDGSAALTVAIEADLATVEAHVASHAA